MFGEINFGFFGPLHFQVYVKFKSKFFLPKAINRFVEELMKHKAAIVSDFIHCDLCSGSVNAQKDFNPFHFPTIFPFFFFFLSPCFHDVCQ
jgi:hypothetical protein